MEESVWPENQGDNDALWEKLRDLESQISAVNPRNLAGIKAKELRAATRSNIYGDSSDGDITFDGATDHNTFSSRSSTTYTLTRDVFGGNIIVNTGVTVKTAGFRIFAAGTAGLTNNGTIHANGGAGGAGGTGSSGSASNNPGGTAGAAGAAAHTGGSLPDSLPGIIGSVGATGGAGGGNTGTNGTAGTNSAKSLGAAGTGGGAGGSGDGAAGGSGGNGGSKTGTVFNLPRSPQAAYYLFDSQPSNTFAVLLGSAGSGSGGSGASGGSSGTTEDGPGGGGSGGSGAPGGMMVIFAYRIINNGIISANGGVGGAGGNGPTLGGNPIDHMVGAGGGGGGAGGSGGVIILVYGIKTGSGEETVTGGAGGAAGAAGTGRAGGAAGNAGTAGTAGNTGTLIEVIVG